MIPKKRFNKQLLLNLTANIIGYLFTNFAGLNESRFKELKPQYPD